MPACRKPPEHSLLTLGLSPGIATRLMIDLHTHSTASDGTLSPSELIATAVEIGLEGIALTDHDTLQGLPTFLRAAKDRPIKAVPGVEIACSWYGRSLHLLGLFIDYKCAALADMLSTVRDNRDIRNQKILQKLAGLGIPLTYKDIEQEAGDHVVGRPHFAAALVAKGICQTPHEAFQKYLGRQAAAYVPRYLPLPEAAISAIHSAGGLAIWAHPAGGPQAGQPARIRQVARQLAQYGLDGIEVFYPDHSEADMKTLASIGRALDLAVSGGSDFHGANMPGIELGVGRGSLEIPLHYLTALTQRLPAHRKGAAPDLES